MALQISGVPKRLNIASADVVPGTVFTTPLNGGSLAIALQEGLALHIFWLTQGKIHPTIFRVGDLPNDLFLFNDSLEIRLGGPVSPPPILPLIHPTFCEVGSIWEHHGATYIGADDKDQFVHVDLDHWKAFRPQTASRFINHWTLWRINGEVETALGTVDLKPGRAPKA